MENKKIYFGHPISEYGTEKETELIAKIKEKFLDHDIENPNQKHHCEGYLRWKKEKNYGMGYFLEEVLPGMESGIFLAFSDGKFGAGVYKEADWLREQGKLIFEIDLDGNIGDLVLDESRFLSVAETRARVYKK